jgi:heme/copper-type cytochrome/quinol oxidase subunit 3
MTPGTLVVDRPAARDPGAAAAEPPWPPEPEDSAPDPVPDRLLAARLGMAVFLAAETMLFGGLVAAFLVFRLGAPVWPPPLQPRLPVGLTALNTAVLLASAWPLRRACAAARRGDAPGVGRGLAATGLLGAAFLGLQGSEWARLLAFGLTAPSGVYGGIFYVVIGTHAAHVLAALLWLATLAAPARRGAEVDGVGLRVFAMYWTFVVALWPVLYALVYLT